MRHPGRPGRRRGEGVAAGPIPTSPDSSPARAWTSWTSPPAWRRAPCATSGRGRPRAGSPCRRPRSRSAPRPGPARAAADVPAAPDRVIETTVDQLAEAELRLLGVPRRRGRPPYRLPSGHRGLVAAQAGYCRRSEPALPAGGRRDVVRVGLGGSGRIAGGCGGTGCFAAGGRGLPGLMPAAAYASSSSRVSRSRRVRASRSSRSRLPRRVASACS
jgi:hypothetical protein